MKFEINLAISDAEMSKMLDSNEYAAELLDKVFYKGGSFIEKINDKIRWILGKEIVKVIKVFNKLNDNEVARIDLFIRKDKGYYKLRFTISISEELYFQYTDYNNEQLRNIVDVILGIKALLLLSKSRIDDTAKRFISNYKIVGD